MRSCCFSQVLLQSSVEHHLRILKRCVIDEPVHLSAHGQGGIKTVLYAGSVDAESLSVGIAQLDAGSVYIELAGYQLSYFSYFLPARKQGRAYQNAYQNQVLFWYTYYHKMYRKSIIFCKYVYYA